MKVIFAGTSEFAVPSLERVIASGHDLLAVVTQPDRPSGRGRGVQMSPVKEIALAHSVPILQPERIGTPESIAELKSYGPIGALIVVAYGQKIPPDILSWPKRGVVNVHGSILPKYRGAAPIQHAIMAGETQTGVTTMLMDEGWDTGDMLLQETVEICPDENVGELSERLALIGANLLIRTLDGIEDGTICSIPQDSELATLARAVSREVGAIDWSRSAADIVNLVRGCTPKPGAFTRVKGTTLKVWKARLDLAAAALSEPGVLARIDSDGLVVAAGSGSVKLVEVQAEARQRMSAPDFARGAKLSVGDAFDVRFQFPQPNAS